ncbi:MAG: ZPR1 zinc finger domain-containing protein [Candidatus Hodarchaeota archaeon]
MSKKQNRAIEDYTFKCPACKEGKIEINKTIYDLPDGDKMLIVKFECNECDFTNNDIIPMTTNFSPGIITLKVANQEDLKSKVYRSPIGKLEIPELELEVEPGPNAEFYYTNVEGILFRFEKAVSIYKNNLDTDDSQKEEIELLLKNLNLALKGEFEFSLKITDVGGGSYIIPQDQSKYQFEKIEGNNLE